MEKIDSGVYKPAQRLMYEPTDFHIVRYGLWGALQDRAAEEAAARILVFGQEQQQWVGVTTNKLVERLEGERAMMREVVRTKSIHDRQMDDYKSDLQHYRKMCWLTLGIYWFMVDPPAKPDGSSDDARGLPASVMYKEGPSALILAVHRLLTQEYVHAEKVEESEWETDWVYFPTQKLLDLAMKYQMIKYGRKAAQTA